LTLNGLHGVISQKKNSRKGNIAFHLKRIIFGNKLRGICFEWRNLAPYPKERTDVYGPEENAHDLA
jgi:hypothetical protein